MLALIAGQCYIETAICATIVIEVYLTLLTRKYRIGRRIDDVLTTAQTFNVAGGGPVRRHNAIRDAVTQWLREIGHHAQVEQVIQEWHSEEAGEAVLDVVYHRGIHGRVCLDISLVNSTAEAAHGRPFKATLQRRERAKHRRYPFQGLVPFVLDVNGRWGNEAETAFSLLFLSRATGSLSPASGRGAADTAARWACMTARRFDNLKLVSGKPPCCSLARST